MKESEALDQIAQVVEKANDLEMRMGLLLSQCLLPATSDYGFLQELILHNTVLDFGRKVQLIERILDFWNWTDLKKRLGPFKELMKLRNAFAHTPLTQRQLLVYFPPGAEYATPLGSEFVVHKKNPVSWDNVERQEAFKSFLEVHGRCVGIVAEISEEIRKTIVKHSVAERSAIARTAQKEG